MRVMSFVELIASADPASADAIQVILDRARAAAPEAQEGVSYSVAALLIDQRALIGIGPHARGYSLFPFSGEIVSEVAELLPGFRLSKGAIGFRGDQPIPVPVIDQILRLRLAQLRRTP